MSTLTRRRFLELAAAGGAALAVPWGVPLRAAAATGMSPNLTRFLDPLPIPPVIDAKNGLAPGFSIAANQFDSYRFHSQLGPAKTFGYGGAKYLGPTIETRRGTPVTITWVNNLDQAFLPNDSTLMGAVLPGDPVPIVTHVHGGPSLPQFDGTPLQWFMKAGEVHPTFGTEAGPHFIPSLGTTFTYGNEQRATLIWYHDHALGNTRTNVYAGLAGAYLVRDADDTGQPGNQLGLPAAPYEVPLVLQDKTFNADGTIWYPTEGVTDVHPVWVPEFFGDTAVVNGVAYPFLAVEPRRYRFRIINGSQARFYNLKFTSLGAKEVLPFVQIGAEGGLLRAPVPLTSLLIAPGERADVIVDFAAARKKGTQWVLKNDAKAPFPMGGGGAVNQLVRFDVSLPLQGTDTTTPAASLQLPSLDRLPDAAVAVTREQQLSETLDAATGEPLELHVEGRPYLGPDGLPEVTTRPVAGQVEDWLLVNTSGDTHPIHLHLVTFEVLDRRPFDVKAYVPGAGPASIPYVGPAVPAAANENGLKDTVMSPPGVVTRIRAKFDLATYAPAVLPPGVTAPQYVWHCHILEHEENDMMRAFEVVPA